MTTRCTLIFMISFVAGNSCKKDNPQPTTPQTKNKWVVTTYAGEGTGAFNDGPLLSAPKIGMTHGGNGCCRRNLVCCRYGQSPDQKNFKWRAVHVCGEQHRGNYEWT